VSQNFIDYLKEKFKSTTFYGLKIGGKLFISLFDTGETPPEFCTLCFRKFKCDVLLIADIKQKRVKVIKNPESDIDIASFTKKVFKKDSGTTFNFTTEFLGITKHFTPYAIN
jgi:hypothetical protein